MVIFQIFLSDINNLKINLFNSKRGHKQAQLLQVKVNLGVMEIKEYSTFPRSQKLEPHHQMQFSVIPRTLLLGRGITPLLRIHSVYSKVVKFGFIQVNNIIITTSYVRKINMISLWKWFEKKKNPLVLIDSFKYMFERNILSWEVGFSKIYSYFSIKFGSTYFFQNLL